MGIILKPGHKTIIYLPPLSLSDLIKQLTGLSMGGVIILVAGL